MKTIEAIFQNGVFKPCEPIDLAECARVKLALMPVNQAEDIPTSALREIAPHSGSFDFLADPREDIYLLEDGEPV